mmetsp:Transcript_20433/g.42848  ORF Transcript_20433/g.42848 Transcript_20433/m.42848 type:complete len:324 (+) Transcript_20433:307-1278(+)
MDTFIDTNTKSELVSLLTDLKSEINACRRQVRDLKNEMGSTEMMFDIYRKDTEAKLTELERQKKLLAREVISLRLKGAYNENANTTLPATAAAAANPNVNLNEQINEHLMNHAKASYQPSLDIKKQAFADQLQVRVGMSNAIFLKMESVENDSNNKMVHNEKLNQAFPGSNSNDETLTAPNSIKMETEADAQQHNADMVTVSQDCERKSSAGSLCSSSSSEGDSGSSRPSSEKGDRFRKQRMHVLRHAARCTDENCKVSRHCAEMKRVWKHIVEEGCADPKCKVKHCMSSKYVISHYNRKQSRASQLICGIAKEPAIKMEASI